MNVRPVRIPTADTASCAPRLGDELDDLYSLRLVVEATGILVTVPTLKASDSRLLADLADDMELYASRGDHRSLVLADRAFHLALVAGGGVRVRGLAEELARRAGCHVQAHLGSVDKRLREHRQILAHALEQDALGCLQAVAEHHLRTVSGLIAEIEPGHPLERVRVAARQLTDYGISALDAA